MWIVDSGGIIRKARRRNCDSCRLTFLALAAHSSYRCPQCGSIEIDHPLGRINPNRPPAPAPSASVIKTLQAGLRITAGIVLAGLICFGGAAGWLSYQGEGLADACSLAAIPTVVAMVILSGFAIGGFLSDPGSDRNAVALVGRACFGLTWMALLVAAIGFTMATDSSGYYRIYHWGQFRGAGYVSDTFLDAVLVIAALVWLFLAGSMVFTSVRDLARLRSRAGIERGSDATP